jgi:hypothetical protein
MLLAKRCPHTGVLNLFAQADPFLAIGSVVRADARSCRWHCYLGQPASGVAPDMHAAERRLVGRYREVLRAAVSARREAALCTPETAAPALRCSKQRPTAAV